MSQVTNISNEIGAFAVDPAAIKKVITKYTTSFAVVNTCMGR